jgi:hypothetical protein
MELSLLGNSTHGAFTGSLVDGKPQGQGVFFVEEGPFNGGKIVGTFVEGELTGFGKGYGNDGYILYEGFFLAGVPHGKGISYFPSSTVKQYEGSFEFGKSHGEGKSYDSGGNLRYDGSWHSGNRHGKGTMFHDELNPSGEPKRGIFEHGETVKEKRRRRKDSRDAAINGTTSHHE